MKSKIAGRALISSIVMLAICITVLLGVTYAWFTDAVTVNGNRIESGRLDMEVYYSATADGTDWKDAEGADTLFSTSGWEPGHTEVIYLRVHNAGDLAFAYKVSVEAVNEVSGTNQQDEIFRLSDYLLFKTVVSDDKYTPVTYTPDAAGRALAQSAAGSEGPIGSTGIVDTGYITADDNDASTHDDDDQYVTLIVYMPETVGNKANFKTGTTPPEVDLKISVVATQKDFESDSFNNEYDAAALDECFFAGHDFIYDTENGRIECDNCHIEYVSSYFAVLGELVENSTVKYHVSVVYSLSSANVGRLAYEGVAISGNTVKYTRQAASPARKVAFYTTGGKLVLDAINDTVYHNGKADEVYIKAVANNCHHELGYVDDMAIRSGRVVISELARVSDIAVTKYADAGNVVIELPDDITKTVAVAVYENQRNDVTIRKGGAKVENIPIAASGTTSDNSTNTEQIFAIPTGSNARIGTQVFNTFENAVNAIDDVLNGSLPIRVVDDQSTVVANTIKQDDTLKVSYDIELTILRNENNSAAQQGQLDVYGKLVNNGVITNDKTKNAGSSALDNVAGLNISGTLENNGDINNRNSMIIVSGKLENNGNIDNSHQSDISNDGGRIENNGHINNGGELDNSSSGSVIINNGVIDNSGELDNSGNNSTINNNGIINNLGSLDNSNGSILESDNSEINGSDVQGNQPAAHVHAPTKVDAVAATCVTPGNSEYYICSCGKYFSDADGTNEIMKDSWVTYTDKHSFEGNTCKHCGCGSFQLGKTKYLTLTAAAQAAEENDVINLINPTYTATLISEGVITGADNITFDLGGNTYKGTITVYGCDGTVITNGKVAPSTGAAFRIGEHKSTIIKWKNLNYGDNLYEAVWGFHPLAPATDVKLIGLNVTPAVGYPALYYTNIEDDLTRGAPTNYCDNDLYGKYIYKTGYTTKDQYINHARGEVFTALDQKDSVSVVGGTYNGIFLGNNVKKSAGQKPGEVITDILTVSDETVLADASAGRYLADGCYLVGSEAGRFAVVQEAPVEFTGRVDKVYYTYVGGADAAIAYARTDEAVAIAENSTVKKVLDQDDAFVVVSVDPDVRWTGGCVSSIVENPEYYEIVETVDAQDANKRVYTIKFIVVVRVYDLGDTRRNPDESTPYKDYGSLVEAFASGNGYYKGYYKLMRDVTVTSSQKLSGYPDYGIYMRGAMMFDLNGFTYTYTGSGTAVLCTTKSGSDSSSFGITDSSSAKTGTIHATGKNAAALIKQNLQTDHFRIEGGNFISDDSYAVCFSGNDLVIKAGSFKSGKTNAVYLSGQGTTTVNNGKFISPSGSIDVYIGGYYTACTINGGTFSSDLSGRSSKISIAVGKSVEDNGDGTWTVK